MKRQELEQFQCFDCDFVGEHKSIEMLVYWQFQHKGHSTITSIGRTVTALQYKKWKNNLKAVK